MPAGRAWKTGSRPAEHRPILDPFAHDGNPFRAKQRPLQREIASVAAEQASQGQGDHTGGAVGDSNLAGGEPERRAEHHVGRFPPDTRQLDEGFDVLGHRAAKPLDEPPAAGDDVLGLVVVEAGHVRAPLVSGGIGRVSPRHVHHEIAPVDPVFAHIQENEDL